MKYGKNIFIESDILPKLAEHSKKTVMHVKAEGVLDCKDEEKIQETWDFYFGKCDLDVLNILIQFKEAYCFFDTHQEAIDAYDEWFPNKDQILEEESHLYVKVEIVSPDLSIVASNG
jgi:hypothetical protein